MLRENQYAGINRDWFLNDKKLIGSIGVLLPEGATGKARFSNGEVTIAEHLLGKGTAVILGYEASRAFFRKSSVMEVMLTLGDFESSILCDRAIVYRLAADQADHYFLIHQTTVKRVDLDFKGFDYIGVSDAVTEENVT